MYRGKTVAVVVPAYNEEGFVGEVVRTLPSFVDRAYVVDDGSTDDTWAEIRRAAAEVNARRRTESDGESFSTGGPVVETIRHEENSGVGAAIKTGYRRVRRDGLDVAAVMNGDAQMDPDVLDRLLDPIVEDRADYAKGNRLLDRSHFEDMSTFRLFGNFVLTYLTKAASGYWKMMDPQNGYTAISSRALDALSLEDLYDDYGFCNHVLIKLNALGMTVADVSMEAVYGDEESTIEYHSFVPSLSALLLTGMLWRLKSRYLLYDFHPLVALYATGALGIGASAVGALASVALTSTPILGVLLSVTLFVVSAAVLTLGAALDLSVNADRELRIHEWDAPVPNGRPPSNETAEVDESEETHVDQATVTTPEPSTPGQSD
jgi:glycosyltransferase involved in cell wall biosynthesis